MKIILFGLIGLNLSSLCQFCNLETWDQVLPPWNKPLVEYGEGGPLIQNPFSQGIRGTDWDGSIYECFNLDCPSNKNKQDLDLSEKKIYELLYFQKLCPGCSKITDKWVIKCSDCTSVKLKKFDYLKAILTRFIYKFF